MITSVLFPTTAPKMPAMKALVCVRFGSDARITDVDVVTASGEVITGEVAHCDVVIASCIVERSRTVCRVAVAGSAEERVSAAGRVLGAACITIGGLVADGSVQTTRHIGVERSRT